jgi:tetratricopeptide (TPR) repeat protein
MAASPYRNKPAHQMLELRSPRYSSAKISILCCVSVTALIWLVFGQTLWHGFVEYDDQNYVYENRDITGGLTLHSVEWAFSHPQARNWHPLTTISHMADCQIFGLQPFGHHLTNVLLHTIAVLLLFVVLRQLTGALWRSAFVAAIFAIHPLRVESVAWIAERKDVLSGVFFMLTLAAYYRYVRAPSVGRYVVVSVTLALGLMSKPMLVTLPLVLLLLDYWPLEGFAHKRSRRTRLLEKIPLLALSVGSCLATAMAQKQTIDYAEQAPLTWRMANALVSYVTYIWQMLWPAKLALFYPHPEDRISAWEIWAAAALLGGVTALVFALRKRHRYLVMGWLWYLGMLAPVIGIVQVGMQAHADRYTYLPHIGLYIAVTWSGAELSKSWRFRDGILAIGAAMVIMVASLGAYMQTSYWRDDESLWSHAAAVTSNNDVAYNNLAAVYLNRSRVTEAIAAYEHALAVRSGESRTYYSLDIALLHNGLGTALDRNGSSLDRAISEYRAAVRIRPDYADAHFNLAEDLLKNGNIEEAIAHYRKLVETPPPDAGSHLALAKALLRTGAEKEAAFHLEKALAIEPNSLAALSNLAWLLATGSDSTLRNSAKAIEFAERAKELSKSTDATVLRTLAAAYAENGQVAEALETSERALSLASAQGRENVAAALRRERVVYESRRSYPQNQ